MSENRQITDTCFCVIVFPLLPMRVPLVTKYYVSLNKKKKIKEEKKKKKKKERINRAF